jgi:hypothetical protein
MYHVRRTGRKQRKAKPRIRQSLQKPNGVISPRVQKVGGEHFAIVWAWPIALFLIANLHLADSAPSV